MLMCSFCVQGIGNGMPLGAVITTAEVAKVLSERNYFNTFAGNPVCSAAGLAVLEVIKKEKLQENAFTVGSYLKQRLTTLKDKYERMCESKKYSIKKQIDVNYESNGIGVQLLEM